MSQIWKKMKKSEMRKTFSGEKVFHFMLKKQLSKVKKNRNVVVVISHCTSCINHTDKPRRITGNYPKYLLKAHSRFGENHCTVGKK